ncbi:hypothetical protein [Corynebacterium meridianum]|uniref:Uncharacterized protein n=1 Tax=Corynebacterium meridianum TaxID=2765363 RepID=A0A934I462_9CORY|nr:hypothetical protein [Corynebacterium meridianum]MBI8988874.1 hypothetical protein [Corynebacterium meridianum]MCK7676523.1 hypothetical protein [Corynebacterium meridianum]
MTPATDRFFWIDGDNNLNGGKISAAGITDQSVVVELGEGAPNGMALQPDGTIGVLLVPERDDSVNHARPVTVDSSGTRTETQLPAAGKLYPGIVSEAADGYGIYGETFTQDNGLAALPDGCWIYAFDHRIQRQDGSTTGATPIHLTPGGPEAASLFTSAATLTANPQGVSGLYTNADGIVGIFNGRNEAGASHPVLGFYRYADGELSEIYSNPRAAEYSAIVGVAAEGDHLYVLSSNDRRLTRLSAIDGSVEDSVVIGQSTAMPERNMNLSNFISLSDRFLVSVPHDDRGTHTRLAVIDRGTADKVADPDVERVTVGRYGFADSLEPVYSVAIGEKLIVPAPEFERRTSTGKVQSPRYNFLGRRH